MLPCTLRNIACYFTKWCFEVLCEMVLHVTLRKITYNVLYSVKYSLMKWRVLQETLIAFH